MIKLREIRIDINLTDDDLYLVTCDYVACHCIGITPVLAVSDFLEALNDLYVQHTIDEATLAPHLLEELETLRNVYIDTDAREHGDD